MITVGECEELACILSQEYTGEMIELIFEWGKILQFDVCCSENEIIFIF